MTNVGNDEPHESEACQELNISDRNENGVDVENDFSGFVLLTYRNAERGPLAADLCRPPPHRIPRVRPL